MSLTTAHSQLLFICLPKWLFTILSLNNYCWLFSRLTNIYWVLLCAKCCRTCKNVWTCSMPTLLKNISFISCKEYYAQTLNTFKYISLFWVQYENEFQCKAVVRWRGYFLVKAKKTRHPLLYKRILSWCQVSDALTIPINIVCAYLLNHSSHIWLCNPMDYILPGSSVHGVSQARLLEWVAMPFSRGSSWLRDWTRVSYIACTGRQVLYH